MSKSFVLIIRHWPNQYIDRKGILIVVVLEYYLFIISNTITHQQSGPPIIFVKAFVSPCGQSYSFQLLVLDPDLILSK